MTPEQEDAHWALVGKPLMRHWLARLSELERADKVRRAGRRLQWAADELDAPLWAEMNTMDAMAALIVKRADAAWWAAVPVDTLVCRRFDPATGEGLVWIVGGVKYTPTDGTDYQLSKENDHEQYE